jgi:hypothetical protein
VTLSVTSAPRAADPRAGRRLSALWRSLGLVGGLLVASLAALTPALLTGRTDASVVDPGLLAGAATAILLELARQWPRLRWLAGLPLAALAGGWGGAALMALARRVAPGAWRAFETGLAALGAYLSTPEGVALLAVVIVAVYVGVHLSRAR